MDPTLFLYGAIFLATLLLIEGLYYFVHDGQRGQFDANRRMRMLSAGKDPKAVFNLLRRPASEKAHYFGPVGQLYTGLNDRITRAGLTIPTNRFIAIMGALAIFAYVGFRLVALRHATISLPVSINLAGVPVALLVGVGIPLLYLSIRRARRLRAFAEQLPDALDVMVRSLRAGHPVNAAMRLVTQEMPDPTGTEFGLAVDEMTYGLEFRDALQNLAARVDLPDLKYVIVSISIQHETGGNLAETLSGLSSIIRDRFRMFKKIRALSAEGRYSARLLCALPFCVVGVLFLIRPEYYLSVADDPIFSVGVAMALVLMSVGMFVMHRMVNFRV